MERYHHGELIARSLRRDVTRAARELGYKEPAPRALGIMAERRHFEYCALEIDYAQGRPGTWRDAAQA